VAEAAKVIENTQRDLNIALMNELSKIFSKLKIDTHEVIAAVICNPVVQIAALKQPVYCAQFPAIFQG